MVVGVDAAAMDGGNGYPGEHRPLGDGYGSLAPAEQSVLAALHIATEPIAPAVLIRALEGEGFPNPEIRTAIWHLLDRHRIRLTRDLRLVMGTASASPAVPPTVAP